ncbi:MAG: hypothetical protein JW839_04550 [Candidatus Lokiarchaeota archaeon]|nr:hypothetical protein [Candidatus Lokiarchaeota archaeon]
MRLDEVGHLAKRVVRGNPHPTLVGGFEIGLLLCIEKRHGRSPFELDDDEVEAIRGEFMDLVASRKDEDSDLCFFENSPPLPRDVDLRIVKMVEMGLIDVDEGAEADPDGKPFTISEGGWALVLKEMKDSNRGRAVDEMDPGPQETTRAAIFPPILPQITGAMREDGPKPVARGKGGGRSKKRSENRSLK